MNTPRSSTETLIAALRILARDIQSEDGLAKAAIAEAAERLEELDEILREAFSGDLTYLSDMAMVPRQTVVRARLAINIGG